jgi:gamma-glutamylcyclotransferase (GGCT)/AIG2-like uncharacterized protein YtfP
MNGFPVIHTHHHKKGTTMKPLHIVLLCFGMLLSSCGTEKALWIEARDNSEQTTIAVTEGIARELLETTKMNVSFSKKGKRDLVTREMLQAVLDGRQQQISAHDDHGSEVTVSLKPLSVPGKKNGKNRLVLETYKAGKQTFRIALPELELSMGDEKREASVNVDLNWKAWLPFLAKAGGAVLIKDHDDDTEVWLYVE